AVPVFQALAILGLKTVVITGGEPAIVPDFANKLAALKRLGMQSTLLTHGIWAKNAKYMDEVLSVDAISSLVMSVKPTNRDTSARVTRRSTMFDDQFTALKNLADATADRRLRRFIVKLLVTTDTIEEVSDLSWMDGLKARPEIVFSLVEPYTDGVRQ